MSERIEIDRQQPLQVDKRGRVTIPSNLRTRHGIEPEEGKEIWVEVDIKYAEVEYEDVDSEVGDGSE